MRNVLVNKGNLYSSFQPWPFVVELPIPIFGQRRSFDCRLASPCGPVSLISTIISVRPDDQRLVQSKSEIKVKYVRDELPKHLQPRSERYSHWKIIEQTESRRDLRHLSFGKVLTVLHPSGKGSGCSNMGIIVHHRIIVPARKLRVFEAEADEHDGLYG